MQPEDILLKEVLEAVKQEEILRARELMTRLLKRDRLNAEYWVWMSALVDTVKERDFCLREAYKLDPENAAAIHGLRLMGENIKDPNPVPPLDPARLKWKTSLELAEQLVVPRAKPRRDRSSWVLLALVVIGLGSAIGLLLRGPRFKPDTSAILRFSLTPPATATLEATPVPWGDGPAPLWTLLEATYTATPVYAATPHNLTESYKAAMRAYEQRDWARALDYFNQVLYSEPASADIHYHIGEIYRFQGLTDQASAAYDKAIQVNPNYAPAYLGKGRAWLMVNPPKVNKARQNFEKALELDPLQYEAYFELASLAILEGDADKALSYLAQRPADAPVAVQTELMKAKAYLLKGDPAAALAAAQAANRIDITNLPAYKLMAEAYLLSDQADNAFAPLQTYLTWVKGDAEAYALMSTLLLTRGEYAEAMQFAATALEIDNSSLYALEVRGEVYLRNGQMDEAAVDFNNVLRTDKTSFIATLGISRIQHARELYGSAHEYARAAYDLARTDREKAYALYWRAMALIGLDEEPAATRDLQDLFSLPEASIPAELKQDAMNAYQKLVTATPTLEPSSTTVTTTPKPTKTPPTASTTTPGN
jgi:tetratricopeptide (TPR) repeat protein